VIASGEVGSQSPPGVQQALRSLLGAYWVSPLAQPSQLQPVVIGEQTVVPRPQPSQPFLGGILMPTGTTSRAIAVWQPLPETSQSLANFPTPSALPPSPPSQLAPSPAVVATDRTIYLGWQWGSAANSSPEVDQLWLATALNRYKPAVQSLETPSVPSSPAPQPETASNAATIIQTAQAPQGETTTSVTQRSPQPSAAPSPAASTSNPSPAQGDTLPPVASPVATPSRPQAINVDPDDTTQESLFPPPRMTVTSAPISHVEAVRMGRELELLAGRVESALVSAYSVDTPINLRLQPQQQVSEPDITVAVSGTLDGLASRDRAQATSLWNGEAMQAVTEARQFLKVFPRLVARRDYRNARHQWLHHQQRLLRNYPLNQPTIHPEIRAIWLDRGTLVQAGSEAGLTVIFDRLAAAGINTVFLETVNAGYPIFPSQVAPQQNPQLQGWDALGSAVKLAHQRGMQLHAWVWVFAAGNERHNQLLGLPANYPGPVIAANPSWANYDNQGKLAPPGQPKPFLDPANPEVRNYLLSLFKEIVTRYPVDGLQLDYIRYPFQNPARNLTYGYGQASRRIFKEQTGIDPITLSPLDPKLDAPASSADRALREEFRALTGVDPTSINPNGRNPVVVTTENAQTKDSGTRTLTERELWQQWSAFRVRRNRELWNQWTDFRVEQVSSFVAEVATTLRRSRPSLILSAAVFPLPERVRLIKIQQQWEVWVQRGYLDLLVPMTYATSTNRFQQLMEPLMELGNTRAVFVLPGIRLLNLPAALAVDQIQTLRDLPFEGYALFAAQDLNDAYHSLFSRTQGVLARCSVQQITCDELTSTPISALQSEPILYRQPFQAAHARYLILKREWSFLLAQGKLQISDSNLRTMRIQAEVLERSLSRLANSPSRQTIFQATRELQAFQQDFPTWIQDHAKEHPYQAKVWENRLISIATLLRYGDRILHRSLD
ncbi:MAG: family 10 glycosylhydrolase, partial [Cyanobacteria bacterium]|nr:family 10 glycosylhydrolase [Cyanobacteriota bacterium]MDW8202243.1 family 10 glycosylhydrolase [Cyanobacteriota bacterium SKYGB_h_bin112]